MAGGKSAVFRSKEGAEDSEKEAVSACRRAGIGRKDVVVGVAASGVTPFVRSALRMAHQQKARAILVTCNPHPPKISGVTIALRTGPEILAGSTRLKAGTACKMVLNMLTTASMVQVGKVYGNRMVDLQPKSRKLVERGIRLIREIGRVPEPEARRLFKEARGQVKAAIVMARKNMTLYEAEKALKRAEGFLRRII
jgi:N-acetylmuramic acid 6-phosphate etherase